MKKVIIALILIAGSIYLYLMLAVNDDRKWFKEFTKHGVDSTKVNDSSHYLENKGSIKGTH